MLLALRNGGVSPRRVWLLCLAAFGLLMLGWSLAMPADGTTDERQHLERAYGVVTGHILAPRDVDPMFHRPSGLVTIPKSLLPSNPNCPYFPNYHPALGYIARAANCQEQTSEDNHARMQVASWVGRYNPVYYALVGAPLRLFPDMRGILLARGLAALYAAAFAATAAAIALWTGRALLLAGVFAVVTPTVVALGSTVNPNGIEITAALLFWVCLVDLARPDLAGAGPAGRRVPERLLVVLAMVAGATLLTVRALGPFWFALALATAAYVAGRTRVRALTRRRSVRVAGAALVLAGILALAWNVVSGNNVVTKTTLAAHPKDGRLVTLLRTVLQQRLGGWLYEAVALDFQPSWVYAAWIAVAAALVVPALLLAERRIVLAAVGAAVVSLGVTVYLDVHYLSTLGWSQFGRYFIPGLAGVAVLGGGVAGTRLPGLLRRRLVVLTAVVTGLCQIWALALEMTRVQAGPTAPISPFAGTWHPKTGSLLPFALECLGAALVVVLAVVAARTSASGAARPGKRETIVLSDTATPNAPEPA